MDAAPWTEPFVDIEGDGRPRRASAPARRCCGTTSIFYVAAEMEEPDVWGTLTERDSVIFHDNDFEVFIDPDGDTHDYYELEINALGTAWDLMLLRPYRDGGPAIDAWDIAGLKAAVHVRGTLNRPGDRGRWLDGRDRDAVEDPARGGARAGSRRSAGDQWRVNFSRVEWQVETSGRPLRQASRSPARRICCPRTTGCGVRRALWTCTCRSAGATCSSRAPLPAAASRSSRTRTNA